MGTIPQVEISDIVSEDFTIRIREQDVVDGNISVPELSVILKLIKLHNPIKLFEIGTFDGRTTLNMAINSSPKAIVYTLDLPRDKLDSTMLPIAQDDRKYIDKEESGTRFLGKKCNRKIVQLYGDSATFDFRPYFNTIDFIFIDGSHSYGYIMNDSKLAVKLLRNGKGTILWHDYDTPHWECVTRALNRLYAKNRIFKNMKHIEGTSLVYNSCV